ncbi:hypothetical protein KFE25_006624 [Diacronema lutheri]|uniref:Homeobox domain-containing protein n=1 Tax=Diacronema lutheri TaxID=2081491 RepID=A0A8J6CAF5_DIALT|nr:hypothetical protein KFE25_006624 [Diacronema lutheri]
MRCSTRANIADVGWSSAPSDATVGEGNHAEQASSSVPSASTANASDAPTRKRTTRGGRRVFTAEQVAILVVAFEREPIPTKAAVAEIAEHVALPAHSVRIWFQNHRSRRRARMCKKAEEAAFALCSLVSNAAKPSRAERDDASKLLVVGATDCPSAPFQMSVLLRPALGGSVAAPAACRAGCMLHAALGGSVAALHASSV